MKSQELQLKLVLRTMVFLSIGFVSGCSWIVGEDGFFDTKQYDYTRAEITKELDVPSSVGESNESDNYFVIESSEELNGEVHGIDSKVMAPMQVLTLGNKARVNRESKIASVYVTMSEISLWDSLERYLSEENIPVSSKDISSSIIRTGWVSKVDDSFWSADITAWRQRYNLILNTASRPSEKILSVELVEAQEYIEDTGKWRNVENPGRLETEFLNSILGFLYVEDIDKSRELVNQSALGGIAVSLGTNADGDAALISSADFENVWGRIPVFLRLLNLSLEDQDRSEGLYFFKLEDTEGFLSSLAFWSDSPETLNMPEGLYTIRIAKLGDKVSISIFDEDNSAISAQDLAKNYPAISKAFKSRVSE
ncbi:MAG: outer membrane protein assembly factor BamC [Enterobacterales bacterium]|jgi:outer membrane protein assembly factor BamC